MDYEAIARQIVARMYQIRDDKEAVQVVAAALRDAAAKARAQEREECARVAIDKGIKNGHLETCGWIAAAIRGR